MPRSGSVRNTCSPQSAPSESSASRCGEMSGSSTVLTSNNMPPRSARSHRREPSRRPPATRTLRPVPSIDETRMEAGPRVHQFRIRLRGDPGRRPRPVRALSGRVLAGAGPRERLPDRLHRGADRGGIPRGAHPRGIRRRRTRPQGGVRHPRDDPAHRVQRGRLSRPDVHHGHAAQARQRGAEAAVPAPDRGGRVASAGVRRE